MNLPTVACVLRSGGEYTWEHVFRLHASVSRWWPAGEPLRFVVLTDVVRHGAEDYRALEVRPLMYGWPRWWSKCELFAPEHDELGRVFFLDLDTTAVGPLLPLLVQEYLTVLNDFYRPDRMIGSGLMMLPVMARAAAWAAWIPNPSGHQRRYRGDQEFLYPLWKDYALRWQDVLPRAVVSYKAHVRPLQGRVPDGARVVCFHGRPRPWHVKGWRTW